MIIAIPMIIGVVQSGKWRTVSSMKQKVAVLGATGMLGSMVDRYFRAGGQLEVYSSVRTDTVGPQQFYFDASQYVCGSGALPGILKEVDYLINCIGVLKPYSKDDDEAGVIRAIEINALLPHRLAEDLKQSSVKIIQIATDCVYSGRTGNYTEDSPHDALDVYGKSKSLGEVREPNYLNLRCSIIGPELKAKLGLLEWFLNQKPGAKLSGFAHHQWNGISTLQFAKICEKIILSGQWENLRKASYVHHFIPNNAVSKYDLLNIFQRVFNTTFMIEKISDVGEALDRTLSSKFDLLESMFGKTDLEQAVRELKAESERLY